MIADLTEVGQRIRIAKGGNGGFGNAHFKSATNQAPDHANPGQIREEQTIWLHLKLIADAGLVGLPNAGKSTFLAAVSAAKPKIADYPFTTLHPNLGVVRAGEVDFVLADIPGLIEGAHEGAGLGDKFLGHVERCRVLLHLVDATGEDVAADYKTVRGELKAYGGDLARKKEIVALSKCDALDADDDRGKGRGLEEGGQEKAADPLGRLGARHEGGAVCADEGNRQGRRQGRSGKSRAQGEMATVKLHRFAVLVQVRDG